MTPSRDPLSLLLAALRAAGNLCEKPKQQHACTVKDLLTLPSAAATGAAGAVVGLGARLAEELKRSLRQAEGRLLHAALAQNHGATMPLRQPAGT